MGQSLIVVVKIKGFGGSGHKHLKILIRNHKIIFWCRMRKWSTDTTNFSVYILSWWNLVQATGPLQNVLESGLQNFGSIIFFLLLSHFVRVHYHGWIEYWQVISLHCGLVKCDRVSELRDHKHRALLVLFLLPCTRHGLIFAYRAVVVAAMGFSTW